MFTTMAISYNHYDAIEEIKQHILVHMVHKH